MGKKQFYMELLKVSNVRCDEDMKNHTSLRVGGKADFLVEPTSIKEIQEIIKLSGKYNQEYYIIGRGSNLLVKSEGIRGVVIKISNNFKGIFKDENTLVVNAGTPLAEVAKFAYKNSLSGMEFASGIPGSVGGAIAMNAGAYGGEMNDIVESVELMDRFGDIYKFSNKEMNFSYRRSFISDNPEYIILSVKLKLKSGNKTEIYEKMIDKATKRSKYQPLDKCNCGSTFKRPEGHFAGQLIEECGLKGFSFNGVEVSSKHAGFIVNNGESTSEDMLYVINRVKEEVKNKFGVILEEEVKII